MPELPEVEHVRRSLETSVAGKIISQAEILDPRLTRPFAPEPVAEALRGETIRGVGRRGKYLILDLGEPQLVCHLRMTGVFRFPAEDGPHLRARLCFEDGSALGYEDVRRFGRWRLYPSGERMNENLDHKLGPEPFGTMWSADDFSEALAGRRITIKGALLDQGIVAGVGNIYADEALHVAGIAPRRPAQSLSSDEVARLRDAVETVLLLGIERGGASISDYRRPDGSRGAMQSALAVYGRAGEACQACASALSSSRIAGRSSVWCATCQR